MSLLTIMQAAADELSLPRPSAVVSATDQQTKTMLALANREGNQLSRRTRWQALIKEATFFTVAADLQGAMIMLAPGFRYLLSNTMWNRSLIQPIRGGMYPEDWQELEAFTVAGPYPKFRIKGDNLYFLPVPTAGQTVAFEYMSNLWCQSSGGTGQTAWAADTDTGVLSEDLMTLGIKWRFLRAKGLDYEEEFNQYESAVADALARDQSLRQIRAGGYGMPRLSDPGVPAGNWSL